MKEIARCLCNHSFFKILLGVPVARPIPELKDWSSKQCQHWIYTEIRQFLETYVFLHTTELNEFVNAVEELMVLDRTGYSCRECGKKFKFHSTRVKYVLLSSFIFLKPHCFSCIRSPSPGASISLISLSQPLPISFYF